MTYRERYGAWAVIIGGSEGVGAELARELARDRVNLVLVARSADKLSALSEDITGNSPVQIRTLALDITGAGASDWVVAAISDIEVGMLICNAGSGAALGRFIDQDLAAHLKLLALNTAAQISLVHYCGREMRSRGRGAIMLIGSGAGEAGTGYMAIYSASKAFQRTFAEALWFEMKPFGIDVAAMILGITKTPQLGRKGYPLDDPAMPGAECSDVAKACLNAIARGPVVHLNETVEIVAELRSRPRTDVIRQLSEKAEFVLRSTKR